MQYYIYRYRHVFCEVLHSRIELKLSELNYWKIITPPSGARGGLKENGQNPDSGSKNSENQNNDAVS